jgi:hypothetical protein
MTPIPNLRSPYSKVGRIVYFGRMIDKIRLFAAGKLPPDYCDNLGDRDPGVFDGRCCSFLRAPYEDIRRRTLEGGTDEEILAWAEELGGRRPDADCVVWNGFMKKRGWRDSPDVVQRLRQRTAAGGLEGKPIETFFDFIDYDEGRDPAATRVWETT